MLNLFYIYRYVAQYFFRFDPNSGKEHKGINVSPTARAEFLSHYWQFRGEHPATPHHNPVGVAGDDARYNLAGQKAIIMMVSMVLHEPRRLEVCRYPFFILREGLSLGKRTLHNVLKVLSWSLNIAFMGAYPALGPFNEDFSKNRRARPGGRLYGGPFALSELRGDWKWHREIFDLRNHYASNCICLFCRATKSRGDFQYSRFDRFRQTGFSAFSSAGFLTHALKNYVPPICFVTGFAPRMISLCTMHTSNLGLCGLLNGGALRGLLERDFFGPASEPLSLRLRVATVRFRSWCSAMRIPQSPWLTVGMLHLSDTTAPELTLKAYHARVFLAFLVVCTHAQLERSRASNQADDDLLLIHASCAALADWHQLLEASPRYLSEGQAAELQRLAYKFLVVYKTLAIRHARASSLRFPLRPKHHGFQELNAQMAAERYNMRFRHTFRDEDQMGQVKAIIRGVHKNLLELRTLWRLQLRLKHAQSDLS